MKTYIAYRVKDQNGRPGALVCREFTDDELLAARESKQVIGQVVTFQIEGDPWNQAYLNLGIRP